MATFPKEESKILTLGQEMSSGFKAHKDLYPAPPVDSRKLDASLSTFIARRDAAVAAQMAAEEATAEKHKALAALTDEMKEDLRYAERAVDFDDIKLKAIGWGGRRANTPLAPPEQALALAIGNEGDGAITLVWQKPAKGGKVAAYRVMRRERATGGKWSTVGMALETEVTLTEQERGKEFEYCVIATNKAGEGAMSGIVTAVL